jgi:gamma-glutamyltranspeptidase / glutathione hydrolase
MTKGVVAAGHSLTAKAAADTLRHGGNAFDACLAALAMATIAEPAFASLGGGGFLMARRAGGEAELYDFFVETPLRRRPAEATSSAAVEADFGHARQSFHIGLGSSATPGVVPGLFAVHAELGTRPLPGLLAPAIYAARAGVALTGFQAYVLTVIAPILTASEGARAIFAPAGNLLKQGDMLRNPAAAETLERLGTEGEALFVSGDVGQAMLAQSAELGGHLAPADLAGYCVRKRRPLVWHHRGATLCLNPPPAASGALIAYALAALEAEPGPPDAVAVYRALEQTNRARARHGQALAGLLQQGRLQGELEALRRAQPAYRGTTHVSVIDEAGNAASASLSNGEGNGHMVGRFGFMLNNMLGEADLVPETGWVPGVRLSSMMAPTVIEAADGSLVALGTGGSNRIRSAVLQVTVNLLDHGMALAQAVSAPRMHVEKCGTLSYEPGLAGIEPAAAEAAKAEAWPEPNLFFGGVHASLRGADGRLQGAGDPRRDGVALIVD